MSEPTDLDAVRNAVLDAFGVSEDELGAIDDGYAAGRLEADAQMAYFKNVVIPARMAAVEQKMETALVVVADGSLTVRFQPDDTP